MAKAITLGEVLELTKQLSLPDKVRLIEEIAPQIEQELKTAQAVQRTTIGGLWKGINISEAEIAEARAEMRGDFPH